MSFCISLWSHCSFGTSSHTSQLCLIDVSTRIFPYFFFFFFRISTKKILVERALLPIQT